MLCADVLFLFVSVALRYFLSGFGDSFRGIGVGLSGVV